MNNTAFEQLVAGAIASGELDVEGAKLDFALGLARVMEIGNINKAALAKLLGVSKPMVTRILRGDTNLTIDTMVRAARAAGGRLHLHVAPKEQAVQWFGLYRSGVVTGVSDHVSRIASVGHSNPWHVSANDHEAQPLAA